MERAGMTSCRLAVFEWFCLLFICPGADRITDGVVCRWLGVRFLAIYSVALRSSQYDRPLLDAVDNAAAAPHVQTANPPLRPAGGSFPGTDRHYTLAIIGHERPLDRKSVV